MASNKEDIKKKLKAKNEEVVNFPQVSAPFIHVLKGLEKNGVEFDNLSIPLNQLKPMQGVVDYDKVNDIIHDIEAGIYSPKPIWVSANNDILDGHHHFVAGIKRNPEDSMSCIKIHADSKQALELLQQIMNEFDDDFKEIESEEAEETDENLEQEKMNLQNDPDTAHIDPVQLMKGMEEEMEHVKDEKIARKIAIDHLKQIPDYYDRLEKMKAEALPAKTKMIVFREKPIKKNAVAGNFFFVNRRDGLKKYEIEFDKLLDTRETGFGLNRINPVVSFCRSWCQIDNLEELAQKKNLPVDKYAARLVAEKAKSMGYDGVNYGDIIIQAF